MLKNFKTGLVAFASLLALSAEAAVSVSVYDPLNSSISSLSFTQVGTVLNVETIWTQSTPAFLLFSGLDGGVVYTFNHTLRNNSGTDWNRVANELLDPAGQANDSTRDPAVQPTGIPLGYTTSNDFDGLSFAQGFGVPRSSSVFASVQVDETTNARDFIDFYNGTLLNGGADTVMTFGLSDNLIAAPQNQPFLLSMRPNMFSTDLPEPETYGLAVAALATFGVLRLKRSGKTAA